MKKASHEDHFRRTDVSCVFRSSTTGRVSGFSILINSNCNCLYFRTPLGFGRFKQTLFVRLIYYEYNYLGSIIMIHDNATMHTISDPFTGLEL